MPPMERPPVSPQVQAQMGPPQAPALNEGMQSMQAGMDRSPAELAAQTCEKILLGVQDETFSPYAKKAIAALRVGVAMVKQKQPQSSGAGMPPPGAMGQQGPGPSPVPPIPGQMPG
jgi:hypothetical protein